MVKVPASILTGVGFIGAQLLGAAFLKIAQTTNSGKTVDIMNDWGIPILNVGLGYALSRYVPAAKPVGVGMASNSMVNAVYRVTGEAIPSSRLLGTYFHFKGLGDISPDEPFSPQLPGVY